MPRSPSLPLAGLLSLAFATPTAWAQDTITVIQPENVRMDVAQVMRVQPVYQTLRATRMEPRCPGTEASEEDEKGLSRIYGAVKGALTRKPKPATAEECEMVPVEREFRRPIAYDVDYVYRGMKYRSRLPYDPGTRLRVRVSVMPHIPPMAER